jgi:hypothetical protein
MAGTKPGQDGVQRQLGGTRHPHAATHGKLKRKAKEPSMAASSLSAGSVVMTGLFHDLTLKRSTVSVVWDNDPDKRMGLPVPDGCSLDELQAEAEKAMRELSDVAARIAVELPK